MFCARSAATTPPAVPSLEAITASTLLSFLVRICSMLRLRDFGRPAFRVLLADDPDIAAAHRGLQHLALAGVEEVRVGVRGRALDEDIVSLGLHGEHGTRLHAAHLDVVEREVEHVRVLDQPVVGDHGDAGLLRARHRGPHRVCILGEDDERLRPLRDQRLDVGELLLVGALRIGSDVARAGRAQGGAHRHLVALPALFLEVGPRHADDLAPGERRRRECGGGQRDEYRRDLLHVALHVRPPRSWVQM